MRFSLLALSAALPLLVSGAAIPKPEITAAPLVKRNNQKVLADAVWTTTSQDAAGNIVMAVTPTVIDGITISASPVSSNTPWASLDESGIPSMVTPTVSNGVTVSASPTPGSEYPTPQFVPPVLRCFGDRVPEDNNVPGYPFCTPKNGTEMVVGETYWITWDPTYWDSDEVTKVKIELIAYPRKGANSELLNTDYISKVDGYYPLYIEGSYIRSDSGYFFITITPLTTSTTTIANVGTKSGPLVRAVNSKKGGSQPITRVPSDNVVTTTSTTSSSGSNVKTIVPAVIVPVVAVLALAFFVVWYLKKQKKTAGSAGSAPQSTNNGEIQLSPSSTHNDVGSILTSETAETANPFKETSRTVL